MSEIVRLSFTSCDKANKAKFAYVGGDHSDEKVVRSVGYLKELVSGSLAPALISGSLELKDVVKEVGLDDVHWVFIKNDGVEFQVLSRAIAPRLLGIRFSIEGGQLKRVHLNDDNNVEVVEPKQ
jgi:hypothetical protein